MKQGDPDTITIPLNRDRVKIIAIGLINPEKIISKNNPFKQLWMRLNNLFFETPAYITPNSLAVEFEELETMLQAQWEKHKPAGETGTEEEAT